MSCMGFDDGDDVGLVVWSLLDTLVGPSLKKINKIQIVKV